MGHPVTPYPSPDTFLPARRKKTTWGMEGTGWRWESSKTLPVGREDFPGFGDHPPGWVVYLPVFLKRSAKTSCDRFGRKEVQGFLYEKDKSEGGTTEGLSLSNYYLARSLF